MLKDDEEFRPEQEFASGSDLQGFLAINLVIIEFSLGLYQGEVGNGMKWPLYTGGWIDILTKELGEGVE